MSPMMVFWVNADLHFRFVDLTGLQNHPKLELVKEQNKHLAFKLCLDLDAFYTGDQCVSPKKHK